MCITGGLQLGSECRVKVKNTTVFKKKDRQEILDIYFVGSSGLFSKWAEPGRWGRHAVKSKLASQTPAA